MDIQTSHDHQTKIDLLKPVLSLLPNPVYIKDREHRWVEVNAAFCDLLGHDRDKLIGKSDFDICPPEQAKLFWERDDIVFTAKQEISNVEETTNSKGELCWVKSKKSYFVADDGREYIIGVLTDLTEEKKREEELIEAKQKALYGTQARANFLANMGHDIRTPMNGLMGMSEILRGTSLDSRQRDILDTLIRSSDSLMRIIDDIMDFSKVDAGLMPINNQTYDLSAMVEGLVDVLGMTARDKGIDLIVNIAPTVPKQVSGDADRLKQILMNLIENALKFTDEGSVTICVNCVVETTTAHLTFKIKDTGIGVPADKLRFIFGQYEHDKDMERVNGVSGLGLTLCKKLAHLMGGKLDANSVEGVGSEFQLSLALPCSLDNNEVETINKILMSHQKHKILIVDDVEENYKAINSMLSRSGLKADYASSAQEAARHLAHAISINDPYAVIFIDYMMPNTDGLLLTGSIRNNPKFASLSIIAMSSVNDYEIQQCFESHNVTDYLLKPIMAESLEAAMNKVNLTKITVPKNQNLLFA